jgi:hypothetical protein
MHDANPTNEVIAQRIVQLVAEFRKRYGTAAGCNRMQFSKTMTDLGVAQDVVPYLGAVFLSDEEFKVFRADSPAINWEEVDKRAERIFRELQHVSRNGEGFRESWIGVNGIGA